MAVYFKDMNALEWSNRVDRQKIMDVFGDQLVPLQRNMHSDYATCFV